MKINKAIFYLTVLITIAAFAAAMAQGQQTMGSSHASPHGDQASHPCPLMQGGEQTKAGAQTDDGHADHLAAVRARGERAMGFSQTQTTHHFILSGDGGVIQIEANDADDIVNRDRIRHHLASIAQAFAEGNFSTPQDVHNEVPPGVLEMQRLKSALKYEYEELERGGRVRISTNNAAALAAVHEFLRFQIKDHQTGDRLEVKD